MELLEGLPVSVPAPPPAVEVRGIAHDSRRVEPDDLFVALIGQRFDGRIFVSEALARGAVAVLARGEAPAGFSGVWLAAAEPRALLGPLAARLYGHPDRELAMVGVTGTNGKSTVMELTAAMLEAAGFASGRVGTLGYRFGERGFAGERTTPEASDLFRLLREMHEAGARAVAMEVSSHALVQGRVEGVGFDVAVFTNLTRDHFDFHAGFDDYFAAKRRLFEQLKPGGRAVVNLDDPYGRKLAGELPSAWTYGEGGTVRVEGARLDRAGIAGELVTPAGRRAFATPLLGRYNLENLLAAAAAASALAVPLEVIATALAAARALPGRMEAVERGQPFLAVVDYAHTDAALEAALRATRELAPRGRLIVVFGCGGDRDPGKRPLMGRVAGQLADLAIATSDNPRSEDPLSILAAVEAGLVQSGASSYLLIADRREAIRRAVEEARAGDALVVAGKGHERVQVVGERQIPFVDREELERALEEKAVGGKRR
jgi:UDP-N-acetylmuramoyl-L-alanyl-D-glutamate--2,6-diaminopimelate ligase